MCLEKIVEGAEEFEWIWAFDATGVEYGAREEKWLHISSIAPICSHLPVHKEKVNKMKKKENRRRKETYLFYWPHLFTTSNNLQVRNICTRMTNGNENENRFLGERSYFFSIEVLFVISKEEYITNYNTGFFDTSHISLSHKAFSFFYLLDFFRSTFCPVALLISFIKYFLGSGYI